MNEMDEVEGKQAMRGMAALIRVFYEELLSQGFEEAEALRLTSEYVRGLASGGSS